MAIQAVDLERFPKEYLFQMRIKFRAYQRREVKKRVQIEKMLREERRKNGWNFWYRT